MKVSIKENSLLAKIACIKLHSSAVALTLGNTIHLSGVNREDFLNDKKWVCHELAHVSQYRRFGFIPFLFMYIRDSILHGYFNNKWEVEARSKEHDLFLLDTVQFI